MGIFDMNNPPSSPDSTLDSDLTNVQTITIQDNTLQPIAPGDWVDVDPSATSPDPNWGYSFQVISVQPGETPAADAATILLTMDNGVSYSGVSLSGSWIQQNYRRVPRAS